MPVKNGFEVIKELKLDSKTSDIPIIIVSSKVLDKDEVKYLNDNIEGIIRKAEFEKDHLAEDVLRMIRKIEAKITGENG
jgi:CheY-like chemotaxis protein